MEVELNQFYFAEREDHFSGGWITSSKFRTLLVAVFNLGIRVMELTYQIISFGEDEDSVLTGWHFYWSFFVIRVLPIIFGVILLIVVLKDHYAGCVIWCLAELGIVLTYGSMMYTISPDKESWDDNDIVNYLYCILRIVSVALVYDFTEHVKGQKIQQEKVDKILLRNHFWYQLSLLHKENAALLASAEEESVK
ncbi:uncharacterized protein LOC118435450 [Folsomia candida]|uniref:uncharacterized protein LOC118435450 n=1 Tax=Folsomia candida TaxID=158441 RepID=UPI001604F3DB|nr:uncharacterized protein LOC118435450 [Folsomia candida]